MGVQVIEGSRTTKRESLPKEYYHEFGEYNDGLFVFL